MNDAFSPKPKRCVSISALTAIAMLAVPLLCHGQLTISVIAGTGNPPITPGAIGDGGPAKNAFIDGPDSVVLDPAGNLYIRETARIRKITPAGIISTVAGTGTNGYSGDDGPAISAQLGMGPQKAGLATDSAGNLYIADSNNYRVRKVDNAGKITTVAGNGKIGLAAQGNGGLATNTALCAPTGLAVDSAGNLYIGSSICGGVRKVDPSGIITTVATKSAGAPLGVAVDDSGNLFLNVTPVASQIRKVTPDGTVTVIAGTGTPGYSGDGGPAASAQLFEVDGLAVDKAGNIFIVDSGNSRIRKVDTSGTITTIAGHGSTGPGAGCQNLFTTGCPATNLKFSGSDIALDPGGTIYTLGFIDGRVYKIASSGAPSPPSISGVVSGAGSQPAIAANSWVTIFGSNLASKTDNWNSSIVNGKLPIAVDGVSVTMGGKPAYVYYISPTQINVLAPDLPAGPITVTVTTSAGTSLSFSATVSQFAPAIFAWPNNQPVATRQDFSYAVKPGTFAGLTTVAAKPGDVLILWATGLGPTNPAAPVGVATPSDKTYSTATLPEVTIKGAVATVYGAALAPGSAGLYQIAIQVPATLPDGDWPIEVSIGGESTPTGMLLSIRQ